MKKTRSRQRQAGPIAMPADQQTVRLTLTRYDPEKKKYIKLENRRLRVHPDRFGELSERLESFIESLSRV